MAAPPLSGVRLTDTQRRILTALCRPCADGSRYATPATNQAIASEVFLSVDAVKAHLRALYRKFGVEPLAHNQKRARLVELVLEGGLLSAEELRGGEGEAAVTGADRTPTGEVPAEKTAPPPATPETPSPSGARRRPGPGRLIAAGAATLLGVGALTLALTGAFSGDSAGSSATESLTPAGYRAAVNESCGLALAGQEQLAGASRAERARAYLGVIETMSGRLESLTPPPGHELALVRFSSGLRRAADFTSEVALDPPGPGTRRSANVVAELTLAAGQVQAGGIGYGLGEDCSQIGRLVAGSARNAAVAP